MRQTIPCVAVVLVTLSASRLHAQQPPVAQQPAVAQPTQPAPTAAAPYAWAAELQTATVAEPQNTTATERTAPIATERTARSIAQQLDAKLAELDELQREIDELRRALAPQQQILISLKCVEVNLTKLDDFGFDFAGENKIASQNPAMRDKICASALPALVQHNIAKIVSEPTLITAPGRKAMFESGQEIPFLSNTGQIEYKQIGTKVELHADVTADENIRLELRAHQTQIDASKETVVDGKTYPSLRRRTIDTGVQIAPGETFVLRGPTEAREVTIALENDETEKSTIQVETLWLIKADLANAESQPSATRTTAKRKLSPTRTR